MGMNVGGSRNVRAEINVTPLVDVVLVLLIIFMVLTPLVMREIDVQVPKKADVEVTPDVAADQVVLGVGADGSLKINQEPVARGALGARIEKIFAGRADKVLFLDAHDDAPYGETVKAMDTCRGAGVATIGIMTRE